MNCIIVLSHLMSKECVLNSESEARVKLAIDKFKTLNFRYLITIGWPYRTDCPIPISSVMRDYIVNNSDIKLNSIISIPLSRDTVGDAYYCLKFLQKYNVKELHVITSDYHVTRTEFIFKTIFQNTIEIKVCGVKTNNVNDELFLLHEKESINAFKSTFSKTNFNKLSSIYNTLSRKHPFYNGDVYAKI
jgi:hypothetical protein